DLRAAGIVNTESHRGCGAGDLYADFFKKRGWGEMTGDEAALEWARTLATLLGGKHKGHVEVHPKFHNERAAYYSFSDAFNPASASGIFLPGYVISRGRFKENPNQAGEEMQIAAGISLSKAGYGDRFTREFPFFFIIVARNSEEAELGKRELGWRLNQYGGRVQLQVIIVPK
ncbi:MAG: hypothetical protein AAB923_03730, partial [Patescibacteria group bacterium]